VAEVAVSPGHKYRQILLPRVRESLPSLEDTAGSWDAWRLRIMLHWAGYVNCRHCRFVKVSWHVSGRIVVRKRVWNLRMKSLTRARLAGPAHCATRDASRSPTAVSVLTASPSFMIVGNRGLHP
jgi:hypothetical protein